VERRATVGGLDVRETEDAPAEWDPRTETRADAEARLLRGPGAKRGEVRATLAAIAKGARLAGYERPDTAAEYWRDLRWLRERLLGKSSAELAAETDDGEDAVHKAVARLAVRAGVYVPGWE
jgi:hypothetical protein